MLDVQGKTDAQINTAIQAEIAAGRYPMAIKVNGTDYKGVLYGFSGTIIPATVTPNSYLTVINAASFREPDVVNADYTPFNYTGTGITGITNGTEFNIQLQREYNSMAESVKVHKGFYVGRYETSLNGVKVESKRNAIVMNNITWYNMYQKQKLYTSNNNIEGMLSGMIYTSQWDQIMIWLRNIKNPSSSNKPYIVDSTEMGNYSNAVQKSGENNYKVNNIYDMAGNVWEYTQGAFTYEGRVLRRKCL